MPVRPKPHDFAQFSIDEGTLGQIAAAFGLPPPEMTLPILVDGSTCTLLERRSATTRKAVFLACGRRMFLKQVPWYCDELHHLEFECTFVGRLADAGLPVARPLVALDGRRWCDLGRARFWLLPWLEGYRYAAASGHAAAAARTLAALHRASEGMSGGYTEDLFYLTADHLSLLGRLRPTLTELVNELRQRLKSWQLDALAKGWVGLGSYGVHGDFNPWNLLFTADDDSICGIVDFDNCDSGSRLHDVAEALMTFCAFNYHNDSTNLAPPAPARLNIDRVHRFLGEYEALLPLDPDERACLPSAVAAIAIELTALGLIRGDFACEDVSDVLQLVDSGIAEAALDSHQFDGASHCAVATRLTAAATTTRPISGAAASVPTGKIAATVLVASGKGGVGKTTVAAALAVCASLRGLRVGVIDADVSSPDMPLVLGAHRRPLSQGTQICPVNVDGVRVLSVGLLDDEDMALVWHLPMTRGLLHQLRHQADWGELDLLLVDMPPGASDALIAAMEILQPDAVVTVSTPHALAQADDRRLRSALGRAGFHRPIRVTNRCNVGEAGEAIALPGDRALEEVCATGMTTALSMAAPLVRARISDLLDQLLNDRRSSHRVPRGDAYRAGLSR